MEKYKKDIQYKKWRNINATPYMFDIYRYKNNLWVDAHLYLKYKQLIT
jgi:hypothetical protein